MNYQGRYVIIGPPGTGKTNHLCNVTIPRVLEEEAESFFPGGRRSPVLICSLTRTAAKVVAGRAADMLPRNAIGTLHAHCWRAIGSPPVIEAGDLAAWNSEHAVYPMSETTVDADDGGGDWNGDQAVGDYWRGEYDAARQSLTPRDRWPIQLAAFVDHWETFKERTGKIDFTDMVASSPDDPPMNPRVVVADEAQDLTPLEWSVIKRWGDRAGALVVAGDPWQALYTWRGADPSPLMETDGATVGVLGQSFRVPATVHAVANRWIRRLTGWRPIEYTPRRTDGRTGDIVPGLLRREHGYMLADPASCVQDAIRQAESGRSVILATASNRQAFAVVMALRAAGAPFSNPWRTGRGGGAWNPFGQRDGVSTRDRLLSLLCWDVSTVGDGAHELTYRDFHRVIERMNVKDHLARGAKSEAKRFAGENPSGGMLAADWSAWTTPAWKDWFAWRIKRVNDETTPLADGVAWWIKALLPAHRRSAEYAAAVLLRRGAAALNEEPRIHVGTIHSFKGAEADVVFLFPDVPYPAWKAMEESRLAADAVAMQFYVGMTRAREELVICGASSRYSAEI